MAIKTSFKVGKSRINVSSKKITTSTRIGKTTFSSNGRVSHKVNKNITISTKMGGIKKSTYKSSGSKYKSSYKPTMSASNINRTSKSNTNYGTKSYRSIGSTSNEYTYRSHESKIDEIPSNNVQPSNTTYIDNKYYINKYIKTKDKKVSEYIEEDTTKAQEDDIEIIRQLKASGYLEKCMNNEKRKENIGDVKKVNEEQEVIKGYGFGCASIGCAIFVWIFGGSVLLSLL